MQGLIEKYDSCWAVQYELETCELNGQILFQEGEWPSEVNIGGTYYDLKKHIREEFTPEASFYLDTRGWIFRIVNG